MNELIIKIESKVISADITSWKNQQEEFLASLTTVFESDEDFARAENEAKEIKAREDAAKAALDVVVNGSKDVSELIEQVNAVIEELAKARRAHTKIVKEKKESIKTEIANKKINELRTLYDAETPISQAFSIRAPFNGQAQRIKGATKNKRTFDSITNAVNTEFAIISAEIMSVVTELNARLAMLPSDKMHLFSDAQSLIASDQDLNVIIEQRIVAEKERIAKAGPAAKQEAVIEPAKERPIMRAGICDSRTLDERTLDDERMGRKKTSDEQLDTFQLTIEGIKFVAKGYSTEQITGIAKKIKGHVDSIKLEKIKG